MRIISGRFKNKKIHFPKNLKTRPLKDNVRENIFNILMHSNEVRTEIDNSKILDLYSGSGSFGLECMSRGAKQISFVENDKDALKTLFKNINLFNIENQTKVFPTSVIQYFEKIKNTIKFNIIFLDPPFKNKHVSSLLNIIKKKNIIDKKHIILVHKEKNSSDEFIGNLNVKIRKTYGRSEIFFLKFF